MTGHDANRRNDIRKAFMLSEQESKSLAALIREDLDCTAALVEAGWGNGDYDPAETEALKAVLHELERKWCV